MNIEFLSIEELKKLDSKELWKIRLEIIEKFNKFITDCNIVLEEKMEDKNEN